MRLFFRMLSAMIIISFLAGVSCLADTTSDASNNVKETVYEEAISVLSALDIMRYNDDGKFAVNDSVTRADFAAVVAKIMNLTDSMAAEEKYFSDVNENATNASSINVVVSIGLMQGDTDGNFYPDKFISGNQAVKTIVSALGYGVVAQSKGGYPSGYLSVAVEKGLLKKLNLEYGADIKRGELAQLVYKALDVDILKIKGYGKDVSLNSIAGVNLLSEYHKIFKGKDIVQANEFTGLSSTEVSAGKGKVIINNNTYNVGSTNATKYLGYKTDFYYLQESLDSERVIRYIKPVKDSSVLVINSDDIEKYLNKEYTYYDSDKIQTAKLSNISDTVFNNKAYLGSGDSVYVPQNGNVTLIDNDNNGIYDVASIESYKTYIVDGADSSAESIRDKYAQARLDLDGNGKKSKILQDGDEVNFDSVAVNDIIMVYADRETPALDKNGQEIKINNKTVTLIDDNNSTVYTIIIIDKKKISGTISEIDNTENAVFINGEKYKVSSDYLAAVKLGNSNAVEMKVGDQGDYYVDNNGYIISAPLAHLSAEDKYGFLLEMKKGSGVDGNMEVKLLASDGNSDSDSNFIYYYLDNNVKVNGKKINRDKILLNTDLYDAANNTVKRQLVLYGLNSSGKISEINTAVIKPAGAKIADYQDVFSLDKQFRGTDESQKAYYANRRLASKYAINEKTNCFLIPAIQQADGSVILNEEASDDDYALEISFSQDYKYTNLDVYDVGLDYYTPTLVFWDTSSVGQTGPKRGNDDSNATIVDKVIKCIDDSGDTNYKIMGYQAGSEVKLLMKHIDTQGVIVETVHNAGSGNITAGDLRQGDVIQYETNASGKISGFKLLLRAATETGGIDGLDGGHQCPPGYTYGVSYVGFGEVKDLYSNLASVDTKNTNNPDDYRIFVHDSGAPVYLFDTKKGEITKTDFLNVQIGDLLMEDSRYGSTTVMLVVKRNE